MKKISFVFGKKERNNKKPETAEKEKEKEKKERKTKLRPSTGENCKKKSTATGQKKLRQEID